MIFKLTFAPWLELTKKYVQIHLKKHARFGLQYTSLAVDELRNTSGLGLGLASLSLVKVAGLSCAPHCHTAGQCAPAAAAAKHCREEGDESSNKACSIVAKSRKRSSNSSRDAIAFAKRLISARIMSCEKLCVSCVSLEKLQEKVQRFQKLCYVNQNKSQVLFGPEIAQFLPERETNCCSSDP